MRKLRPSLITSFRPQGLLGPAIGSLKLAAPYDGSRYTSGSIDAELYLFMESDVREWLNGWRSDPSELTSATALEFLSGLTALQVDQVAQEIVAGFGRDSQVRGVTPIGIASFLPEIAKVPTQQSAAMAVAAIANLLKIAQVIGRELQTSMTVELVAGSLVDAIAAPSDGGDKPDPPLFAQLLDDEEGRTRVLDAIARAWKESEVPPDDMSPRCVLELEPGPLFVLRDAATLLDFAADIARREATCECFRRVGFNLDIAHWWLADLTPNWLEQPGNAAVRDRIFHAHISGHSSRGHFGDTSLEFLPTQEARQFRHWLEWLRSSAPHAFSGVVSVELEAAYDDDIVVSSVRQLLSWLQESHD